MSVPEAVKCFESMFDEGQLLCFGLELFQAVADERAVVQQLTEIGPKYGILTLCGYESSTRACLTTIVYEVNFTCCTEGPLAFWAFRCRPSRAQLNIHPVQAHSCLQTD